VAGLNASELYLTTACANQAREFASSDQPNRHHELSRLAWKVFSSRYKGFIGELARLAFGHGGAPEDLTDRMLDYLLLPDGSRTSRISVYDGRSSLHTWLRVVIRSASVQMQDPQPSGVTGTHASSPDKPVPAKIGQLLVENSYGVRLADVLTAAFRELAPKERLILLWQHRDRLPQEKVAELFGMDRFRAQRFLERTRLKLDNKVVAILTKHGMSTSSIRDSLEDIAENFGDVISMLVQ